MPADRRETIRLFIKGHMDILTSPAFMPRSFKQEKNSFFMEKHHMEPPEAKEIAYEAMEYLFRINYIQNSDDLTKVLRLPFFKDNIRDPTVFIERLNLEKSPVVGIDYKRLREKEYETVLKEQIKREIAIESTREIEEMALKRKEEFDQYPSVLDEKEFQEPSVEVEEETAEAWVPWWKKLKFRANPFPSQEGLAQIGDDMYERVVFKTTIFQKYAYYIHDEPGELFKETIFFGEFGSGKTTLFDYLKRFLINERIYPLYIQLYAEQDFQSFLIRFRKKLWEQLQRLYEILSAGHQLESETQDLQQDITNALRRVQTEFQANGFVIFIDDLHKDQRYFAVAMDFLNHLQIFKSELVRSLPQIQIAFYVSGSTDWGRIISNDPKYSGSIYKREPMPPVTAEVAYEMLNRRLEAFSSNPDNYKSGGGITLDYVRKIYRGLENNHLPISFRSFIRSVLSEFEKGNFTILQADPIHIPPTTLVSIKRRLESSWDLRKRLNNLIYGGGIQKEEARARCLEVLVTIYLQGGINEGSSYFAENAYYIQRLMRARLIDKMRADKGWNWVVCRPLYDANKSLRQEFNLSMEDYLLHVYFTPKIRVKVPAQYRQDEAEVEQFIPKLVGDTKSFLSDALRDHKRVLEIREQFTLEADPDEIVSLCVRSLSAMTNAILALQKVPLRIANVEELQDFWSSFWVYPSEVSEFAKLVRDKGVYAETVWYICNTYRDCFSSLFSVLQDEVDKSRYFMIPLADLTNGEIKELHNVRDLWLEKDFPNIVDRISKLNERKLRTFLFNLFRLQFGEELDSRLKHVDGATSGYVLSNLSKQREKNLPVGTNEFEQVNRGNYKNFLLGVYGSNVGRYNWDNTFSFVFAPWSEVELANFLGLQAEFNLEVTHQKENALTAEQQSRVYAFVLQSIEFVRRINHAYFTILQSGIYEFDTGSVPRRAFYVSFIKCKDKAQLAPIHIDPHEVERVFNLLSAKSTLTLDISDYAFIESYYNLRYSQFTVFLSKALNQTPDEVNRTRTKVILTRSQGCDATISISST